MSTTEKRKTSADLKAEIEVKTKEMKEAVKNGTVPLTPGVVAEINASESTPETPQAASKPEPVKAAEPATGNSVDYKEWAKKKGIDWTTDSTVLAALHKSDQEFHKKRAEEKAKEPAPPAYIPPPSQPAYGYQPAYVPPTPNQRQIIEELARANNMTPEDFERVARVSREVYEANAQLDRVKWQKEMESIKLAEQKNSVFRELSSDPVFRNQEVAVEYHNVLEQMQASDPVSFEKDPLQYKRAYDKALSNIGRRNLEGKSLAEGATPPINTLPTTPPKPFGQGSGGGYAEQESAIDMKTWNDLSPADKKKWFQERGLVSNY